MCAVPNCVPPAPPPGLSLWVSALLRATAAAPRREDVVQGLLDAAGLPAYLRSRRVLALAAVQLLFEAYFSKQAQKSC